MDCRSKRTRLALCLGVGLCKPPNRSSARICDGRTVFRDVIESRVHNCCQQSKLLWSRSVLDVFVFPARGSSNRKLGTRLDGINWRRASFHSLKGACLLSIRSAVQRGLAATLWETDYTQVPPYCSLRSVATRIIWASVQNTRTRYVACSLAYRNESDLGIVDGHGYQCGRGAKGHPRRICG